MKAKLKHPMNSIVAEQHLHELQRCLECIRTHENARTRQNEDYIKELLGSTPKIVRRALKYYYFKSLK